MSGKVAFVFLCFKRITRAAAWIMDSNRGREASRDTSLEAIAICGFHCDSEFTVLGYILMGKRIELADGLDLRYE